MAPFRHKIDTSCKCNRRRDRAYVTKSSYDDLRRCFVAGTLTGVVIETVVGIALVRHLRECCAFFLLPPLSCSTNGAIKGREKMLFEALMQETLTLVCIRPNSY